MRLGIKSSTSKVQGKYFVLLVIFTIFQLPFSAAMGAVFANSAAPRILPDRSQVMFQENPGLELRHETIVMEWDPETLSAQVTVHYHFRNPTDEGKALTLWFMSGDYEDQSFQISRFGERLPSETVPVENYQLSNWQFNASPPFQTPYNDPLEGQVVYYGDADSPARITEWVLSMQPLEMAEVEVTYKAVSGYLNESDYFTPYRTLFYALSPAAFFDGEAVLDLELIVPENWDAAANLPLEALGNGRYLLKDYVITSDDLYLSLIDKNKLMLGLNSRAVLFRWTWPFAAAGLAAALLMRKKKRAATALVLASLAVMGLNIVKPSYGMAFMMIFFLPMVIVLLMILAAIIYFYRRRKKNSDGPPS